MVERNTLRPRAAASLRRRALAIVMCTAITSTVALPQALAEPTATPASVGSLAEQIAQAQTDLNNLLNEEGGYRQAAVKAMDELAKAAAEADDAQAKVVSARAKLDDSQRAMDAAQDNLDNLARAQYSQGKDATVVSLAAGADAVADTLDRATYVRTEAAKQRQTLDDLDLQRTQNANEDSSLRKLAAEASAKRDTAKANKDAALDAIKSNASKIAALQSQISEKKETYNTLVAQLEAAKAAASSQQAQPSAEASSSAQPEASSTPDAHADSSQQADPAADAAAQDAASQAAAEKAKKVDDLTAQRKQAASDAEAAIQAALDAVNTAQSKTDAGADDATSAKQTAADKTFAAAKAVKKVEDLTAQLRELLGASGVDSALPGMSSAGLGALAAALEASVTGGDPAAAAQKAGADLSGPVVEKLSSTSIGERLVNLISSLNNSDDAVTRVVDGTDSTSISADLGGNAAVPPTTGGTTTAADTGTAAAAITTEAAAQPTADAEAHNAAPTSEAAPATTTEAPAEAAPTTAPAVQVPDAPSVEVIEKETPDPEPEPAPAEETTDQKIETVINRAMSQLGVRYSWGGGNYDGPTVGIRDYGVGDSYGDYYTPGFDCSGLVMYAFAAVGIYLVHYSGTQYTSGAQYPASEMKRGDLIFYGPGGSQHVAIYLGDGQMLEAPQSGDVVKVSPVRWAGMTPNVTRLIE